MAAGPGGVPVAAGAGDQAAGALGVGVDRAGPASVVLGTSGVVFAALPTMPPTPRARVHAFCHAVPDTWHAMGVMLSAAGSLRWLRDALGATSSTTRCSPEAERWEPGVEGLLFPPYLAGERTPHPDPDARGAFLGLGLRHDRGALTRAVLEGVAFGLRDALDLVRRDGRGARRAGASRAAAGAARCGSRSSPRCSGCRSSSRAPTRARRTVRRCSAAWPRACGATRARRSSACVQVTRTIEPRPEWVERYAEIQPAFRRVYPALRAVRGD